ncbi:TetR family transcriptional regulator [Stackebrandtia endophytica]|uniref:TetR family transcriptional regulator n=1 Tax=Stackebrandtia endophytica TaxID=1496996 RepID=A0A543AWQ7_9ACTN|nr:TetR/AcrR family transcriptional regulator [Stackebrandtia endophytica]TQL76994.1 TetR family transcriptional regulator [Stackebrandtia endophytica]
MVDGPDRRRYESLRRTAQAKETRAQIAVAARELFISRGWAATTIRDVAELAGVSVPTVYSAYQNKTGLALALADAANLSADLTRMVAELEADDGSPQRQLAAMAGYDRRLFELQGELIVRIREAGRSTPELAEVYRNGRRGADQTRYQVFESWPQGTLRPGLDIDGAVDIYAALCNVDVYLTLTVEREWNPDRVEEWWGGVLERELLAPGR